MSRINSFTKCIVIKKQYFQDVFPACDCTGRENGPWYTHLGYAENPQELRYAHFIMIYTISFLKYIWWCYKASSFSCELSNHLFSEMDRLHCTIVVPYVDVHESKSRLAIHSFLVITVNTRIWIYAKCLKC